VTSDGLTLPCGGGGGDLSETSVSLFGQGALPLPASGPGDGQGWEAEAEGCFLFRLAHGGMPVFFGHPPEEERSSSSKLAPGQFAPPRRRRRRPQEALVPEVGRTAEEVAHGGPRLDIAPRQENPRSTWFVKDEIRQRHRGVVGLSDTGRAQDKRKQCRFAQVELSSARFDLRDCRADPEQACPSSRGRHLVLPEPGLFPV
jgi:hypothetical protein